MQANEELVKLRQEVASLQDASTMSTGDGEEDDDEGNDVGEKLTELYEKLQLMDPMLLRLKLPKFLLGWVLLKICKVEQHGPLVVVGE
ncbi:hypothetical protein SASPL_129041 [Salvia splendens]|uniref:Uncharacterized protein n=1 Tax=Salvia splendens TaxID=180675 RepID=A0A8X8ZNC5_SALSN|nr:hypothetical protein SASPL_129041 [Salvia splendens]